MLPLPRETITAIDDFCDMDTKIKLRKATGLGWERICQATLDELAELLERKFGLIDSDEFDDWHIIYDYDYMYTNFMRETKPCETCEHYEHYAPGGTTRFPLDSPERFCEECKHKDADPTHWMTFLEYEAQLKRNTEEYEKYLKDFEA